MVKNLKQELNSERLLRVAKEITPGSRVADIGTDHAYLPVYLIENQIASYVIGSEIAEGPLENGRANVAKAGLSKQIELRFGSGVETLTTDDHIDTITICGMGGKTIVSILAKGWEDGLLPVKELVLQPNTDEHLVRFWLTQHGYTITNESLLTERKGTYEIITAQYTEEVPTYSHLELRFGPFLLAEKSAEFQEKQQKELENYQKVYQKIPEGTAKANYIAQKIKELKEVLSC